MSVLREVATFPEVENISDSGDLTTETPSYAKAPACHAKAQSEFSDGVAPLFFRQNHRIYRIVACLILLVAVGLIGMFVWPGRDKSVAAKPVSRDVESDSPEQKVTNEVVEVESDGVKQEDVVPDLSTAKVDTHEGEEKKISEEDKSTVSVAEIKEKKGEETKSSELDQIDKPTAEVVIPEILPDPSAEKKVAQVKEELKTDAKRENMATADQRKSVKEPAVVSKDLQDSRVEDFDVKLELVGGRTEFVEGEKLQYHIKSDKDCYVALLCYQVDETTVVLFPNRWNRDSFVKAGRDYLVPHVDSCFEIAVGIPFGEDRVELIACTGRSELHRMLGGYAAFTTRDIPFSKVSKNKIEEFDTRGMRVTAKVGEDEVKWVRKSITIRTSKE